MRFWSILFALTGLIVVGVFAYAPFDPNWWLPNTFRPPGSTESVTVNASVSRIGREVDHLFLIILWLTGLTFVGVQLAFVYVTWKYGDAPGRSAAYTHGSKRLEIIWTIIPAFILVFIAVYQLNTWARIKFRTHAPDVPPIAEITARQFQWIARYPGDDGKLYTDDDLFSVNDFHFYIDEEEGADGQKVSRDTLIWLRSSDVLHSFYLPHLRVKQDAVPGLTIPVWFNADKPGEYELVCAELCGWGHYKMRSKMTVHRDKADFQAWLDELKKKQNFDGRPGSGVSTASAATGGSTR